MKQCDISVVLGSKNRKQLIRATIESIRKINSMVQWKSL